MLWPSTVGTRPKNKNQQKCSKVKINNGTLNRAATIAMVIAATRNRDLPYITFLVFFRISDAKIYVIAIHSPLNKELKLP